MLRRPTFYYEQLPDTPPTYSREASITANPTSYNFNVFK
jgi:hypothetical protein